MMGIKNIFFDLDRTLWDFEKNSKTALFQLYGELQLHKYCNSFDAFYKTYRKVNATYWEEYSKGRVSKEKLRIGRFLSTLEVFECFDKDVAHQLGEEYVKISPYQTKLFPDTKRILSELKENSYRLQIITNGFKEVQFIKLKNSGILHFFDDVLCSEEIGKNKPDPRVFYAALKRNKAHHSNSVMIGDDFNADIIGAEKVGMQAILFDPENNYENRFTSNRIEKLKQIPNLLLGLNK